MPDEEGKENMPTPEQPKGGLPAKPEEMTQREIKPIAGGAPWVVENPDKIEDPKLKRIAVALEKTPEVLRTEQRLQNAFLRIEELYIGGVDEAEPILGKINRKLEELAKSRAEAEPEIERLERPKTPEEAVGIFFDEVFNLHERGLREGKGWEKTGELYSEYTTLQRWVGDINKDWGKEDKRAEKINGYLGKALAREFPGGVALKEKLTLLLEAMKRLHNRQIEVIRAGGGLEDLGVGKVGEAAAPILKVPLTNIRPVDWYVITHVEELFPESSSPETKVDLNSAWSLWQDIGKQPFEKKDGQWRLKKIKIGTRQTGYTLEDLFQSERVMAEVRSGIRGELKKKKAGGFSDEEIEAATARAESLAHSILTVSLTFDMWDRERWKQKGKMDTRDLMWFDWKRMERLLQARPAGPADTVGCYWFFDDLKREFKPDVYSRLNRKEAGRRLKILEENRSRAVFVVKNEDPSEGTIIGDFFHSTTLKDQRGKMQRLSDVSSLMEIPWLETGKFEEETYEGYFTYSMMFAAQVHEYTNKLSWKPDDLKDREFWVRLADTTLRLSHFSPYLVTRDNLIREDLILRFRQTLARGILWTGSYLAQPSPNGFFTSGTFSKEDVYGGTFLKMKQAPGILDAIAAVGYLDRESLKDLRREIVRFNFDRRGRKGRQ